MFKHDSRQSLSTYHKENKCKSKCLIIEKG
ncbi:MAG: hypothetical protein [Malazfec virus 1]